MRQPKLLRSTPFRLAITFSLLFVSAFVIASLIVYQLLRTELLAKLDERVQNTYTVVAATYGDGDMEDLIQVVQNHSKMTTVDDGMFSLIDASGKKLAGNFVGIGMPAGFTTLSSAALGVPGHSSYRVYSGALGANSLSVAASVSDTEDIETIFLMSFGWAMLIVPGLAVIGGALLASSVQRRLDRIASTMMDVSHGNLSARIPLTGNKDDIDAVSGQINFAIERLSGLVEGMKQVSADIAHDLKTPLGRLQIILHNAIEAVAAGEDVGGDLVDAHAESSRINETFEALLRIAQLESGARKSRFTRVALKDIVSNIAEAYLDVAADQGMSLSLAGISLSGTEVLGDRELLLQLCSNLIENAIAHCPVGTQISMGLVSTSDAVSLFVADTGPGIPENERTKVLRRLYRLEKSRTTEGSGLGLSLVKAIADLHGAELVLDDNQPGLRVSLRFPRFAG